MSLLSRIRAMFLLFDGGVNDGVVVDFVHRSLISIIF
jgi:hypothetical protein